MEIRRERKVVTVVFVDLVGFTARSEAMDPEDVEVELSRYHAQVRGELERFGGTVEKFIGDAVMAVFGAPVTHEDDAERAVRAALAVRDWATGGGGLDVRVGVNTGEALVRIGAQAEAGEGMAVGDVVNTAARLQSSAPTNGVIVGDATYRATKSFIEFEPTEAVTAKGKSQPVTAWLATEARARFGVDIAATARTTFVGREHELGLLRSALARARAESQPQLVTLVGVPGIGKSRLLHELSRLVDADPELVVWRQGRCLPYGDGVSLWALTEIVKADAGILDNDGPDVAEEKLAKTLDARGEHLDVEWMLTRLGPLVGIVGDDTTPAAREEQFAAWRQFVEGLADDGPAVVVFEDVHWADDTLLDFLDELVELTTSVPLLVVATARPELLVKRPAWGGGRANALTLSLQRLTIELTAHLVSEVLAASGASAEVTAAILDRAEGNPLYAEEFARMVAEQPDAGVRLPDNVHGIIAARLDTLEPQQKRLLQVAAVVGKVFWASAVATLADTTAADVEAGLRGLERRELIRRERRSTLGADTQYEFRHVVTRDVAYGQIPRADRAVLHREVAEWLSALGRPDDNAELIAHHYVSALDYATAAAADVDVLTPAARRALRDAGDRAVTLGGYGVGMELFTKALLLAPADDAERAELLAAAGRSRWLATGEVPVELAEAAELFERLGRAEDAADVAVWLGRAEGLNGARAAAETWLTKADGLLATSPNSLVRHRAVLARASLEVVAGHFQRAFEVVSADLEELERLGRPELLARALDIIGCSRAMGGDEAGLELQRRAIDIARSGRAVFELQIALNNLGAALVGFGRLAEIRDVLNMRQETFDTFGGSAETRNWFAFSSAAHDFAEGNWDRALQLVSTVLDRLHPGTTNRLESVARTLRMRILVARDIGYDPRPDIARAVSVARATRDSKTTSETLISLAGVLAVVGEVGEGQTLWDEAIARYAGWPPSARDDEIANLALTAVQLGVEDAALNVLPDAQSVWTEVATALLRHDFGGAADRLHEIGDLSAAAQADLWAGGERLQRALDFYRSVGATRYAEQAADKLRTASG